MSVRECLRDRLHFRIASFGAKVMSQSPGPGLPTGVGMVTKSSLILVFAAAFTFFILAPPFLGIPFPAYSDMHWADVLDILTPLVLLPLYWLLFTDSGRRSRSLALAVLFLVLAAVWAEGQGMHLSANSINNLLGEGTTSVNQLVHFYDEVLSHYLWHIGIAGMSILLVALPLGGEAARPRWALIVPAAILYGFTYFAAINEGGTVPFGLPAAVAVVIGLLVSRRKELGSHNLIGFFFWAYVVALILFAIWGAYWRGFPEFSETGLL
jgi:hypothetical protein